MKKRWTGLLAALLAVGLLAGCGDSADDSGNDNSGKNGGTEEAFVLNEMKVEDYVTLGDYSNLEVALQDYTVSEESRDKLLLALYQGYITEEDGITDRAVKDGDTVIIDYVGTKDGVAFQGGTSTGASLSIGSGQFIDGFESGLIGVMPGSTVELNLTFPESYRNTELAGQPVVFTVTVQYILPGLDEMKDSVVEAQGFDEVKSVAQLRQQVEDYLNSSAEQQRVYAIQNGVMEQLIQGSTVGELPEAFVQGYEELYRKNVEIMAASVNMTADNYTNYYYSMGLDDFTALYGEVQARQELLLQSVANREGLTVSDEELDGKMEEYAVQVGYASVEEMLQDLTREQLRNYFMSEKVMDYLVGITKTTTADSEK